MSVTALLGLQWGDEGKGKIVDALGEDIDIVVRAQGGANAGHTVRVGDKTRVLHLIPSAMLNGHVRGVIGNGVVVDPVTLVRELDTLAQSGILIEDRLVLSDRAHLVLPWHQALDEAMETARGASAIGTTKRGIGPAYMDKVARNGIPAAWLTRPTDLTERVRADLEQKNLLLRAYNAPSLKTEDFLPRLLEVAQRLAPLVRDSVGLLLDAEQRGERILIEGAQGALLDVDLGSYPFVTSSNCHIGGLLAGSGMPPRSVGRVIAVAKAYCTRVGSGPFPTEDLGSVGDGLRKRGHEFGSTTGRPRRCGWFDLVAARFAARTNGVTEIALTKADVLSGEPIVKVCTAYEIDGVRTMDFPGAALDRAKPVFEELEGWSEDLTQRRDDAELPQALQALIARLETGIGVPVTLVSTGPERSQTVMRSRSA
ncbi:MAG: adenylosuccinate synthase [Planctomycetes bacterium]|nr:adenylosuccinate synthase [Planctomycetota bacterium]